MHINALELSNYISYTFLMKRISIYYNFAIALSFLSSQTALAEDVNVSTFYPSPYGNYQELETTSDTSLATVSGNVGIGTTTPAGKLQVTGTGTVLFNTTGNVGIGTVTPSSQLHVVHPAAVPALRVDRGPADLSPFVIDRNGNVGIGTASPQNMLDVASGIKIGDWATCDGAHAGTIRWAGNASDEQFQFCDGSVWRRSLSEASTCSPEGDTKTTRYKGCSSGFGTPVREGTADYICADNGNGVLKWKVTSTTCP